MQVNKQIVHKQHVTWNLCVDKCGIDGFLNCCYFSLFSTLVSIDFYLAYVAQLGVMKFI